MHDDGVPSRMQSRFPAPQAEYPVLWLLARPSPIEYRCDALGHRWKITRKRSGIRRMSAQLSFNTGNFRAPFFLPNRQRHDEDTSF